MAKRVVASEVRQIMENCTLDDPTIDAYIVGANAIVIGVFGDDTSTLSKEIEKWLTAHMIASSKQRQGLIEKLGDAAITYTGKFETELKSTTYGQMVLTLDISGKMGKIGKREASIYTITSPTFEG